MTQQWNIEVFTTCAVDHLSWDNHYPPGISESNGVRVRRLPVDRPRDQRAFDRLSAIVSQPGHRFADEIAWAESQGPIVKAFLPCLRAESSRFDFFVFFTYLFELTRTGLPMVGKRSALVPTAHDELPIYLGIYRPIFTGAGALIFGTPEERDFVNGQFETYHTPQAVVGVGMDLAGHPDAGRFLAQHPDLAAADRLVYVGRIESAKGCDDLLRYFQRFRAAASRPLKLILLGVSAMPIPPHPDIVSLGFVGEDEKFDALAAATVVVLPSRYESLSMVALEAWSVGRPVLANGDCAVLRGQCLRSKGGLWYESYAEFREALSLLLGEPALAARLGAAGRAFVEQYYQWSRIEAKYLDVAERAFGPTAYDAAAEGAA